MAVYSIYCKDLYHNIKNQLTPGYNKEADNLAILLLQHFFNLERTDIVTNKQIFLEKVRQSELQAALDRLKSREPIQYILEESVFLGRKFKVRQGVLIPRPETEELVLEVKNNNPFQKPSILDIGIGSGCIAVSVGLEIPGSKITGWDISKIALEQSRENAEYWQVNLDLNCVDIFTENIPNQYFNIIVSNPPYVRESEKRFMNPNVLDYEPGSALFVKDSDPLKYYRRILDLTEKILLPEGKLFFEINESTGSQLKQLLNDYNFREITLKKDIHERDRIIFGTKSGENNHAI